MDNLYIRVDGNDIIATGHVMRCITIAQQLNKIGINTIFILADSYPAEIIKKYGFDFAILDSVWNNLDLEIDKICNFIKENKIRKLLLDSYYVTESYLESISKLTNIIYIDDIKKFKYPVNTIIHYNIFVETEKYRSQIEKDGSINFLLGGMYAPLREEFSHQEYRVRDNVNKILITTGGTDKYNVAGNLLDFFGEKAELKNIEFHVVSGVFNTNKNYLKKIADKNNNIFLYENINNMSDLMRMCDVAISASGTTLYELCACGIPTICFTIADNQKGAEKWQDSGLMFYAGNVEENMSDCINKCYVDLKKYMSDKKIRMNNSKKMQSVIDGYGAQRIAEYIKEM